VHDVEKDLTVSLTQDSEALLQVQDLVTEFHTEEGLIRAVDGVSFDLEAGETLGMVGESGSGKSVTSLSIMRLIKKPARIAKGKVILEGQNLLKKSEEEMRKIRGNRISMIFQEPMTSLNPVFTVGRQIGEVFKVHQGMSDKEAEAKAIEMLRMVGIPAPEQRVKDYPHQMSGGMRQRAMIAMALSCHPTVLIADEPTTALDVTVQAQILELLRELVDELNMSLLLITHDMGVIAEMADRVAVMYAGHLVEIGEVEDIFYEPLHPYTRGLLASIPSLDSHRGRLHVIEGTVPNMVSPPPGCRFHPRCPVATEECSLYTPPMKDFGGHSVACLKYSQVSEEVTVS
jgi:oligopeptide transport system ATP-binding protein